MGKGIFRNLWKPFIYLYERRFSFFYLYERRFSFFFLWKKIVIYLWFMNYIFLFLWKNILILLFLWNKKSTQFSLWIVFMQSIGGFNCTKRHLGVLQIYNGGGESSMEAFKLPKMSIPQMLHPKFVPCKTITIIFIQVGTRYNFVWFHLFVWFAHTSGYTLEPKGLSISKDGCDPRCDPLAPLEIHSQSGIQQYMASYSILYTSPN